MSNDDAAPESQDRITVGEPSQEIQQATQEIRNDIAQSVSEAITYIKSNSDPSKDFASSLIGEFRSLNDEIYRDTEKAMSVSGTVAQGHNGETQARRLTAEDRYLALVTRVATELLTDDDQSLLFINWNTLDFSNHELTDREQLGLGITLANVHGHSIQRKGDTLVIDGVEVNQEVLDRIDGNNFWRANFYLNMVDLKRGKLDNLKPEALVNLLEARATRIKLSFENKLAGMPTEMQ